jgi:hypothetical protein
VTTASRPLQSRQPVPVSHSCCIPDLVLPLLLLLLLLLSAQIGGSLFLLRLSCRLFFSSRAFHQRTKRREITVLRVKQTCSKKPRPFHLTPCKAIVFYNWIGTTTTQGKPTSPFWAEDVRTASWYRCILNHDVLLRRRTAIRTAAIRTRCKRRPVTAAETLN